MRWASYSSLLGVARRWALADPMVRWSREVELRRGKKVAIVALARKMAGIMFANSQGRLDVRPPTRATPASTAQAERMTAARTLIAARARK